MHTRTGRGPHAAQDNPSSRDQIARAGSAESLIALLKRGAADAQAYALWSLSLSIDASNQSTVLADEGVAPLVASLAAAETVKREQAAAALHRLALGCPEAQLAINHAGGISPLILILDASVGAEESGKAREYATSTHLPRPII